MVFAASSDSKTTMLNPVVPSCPVPRYESRGLQYAGPTCSRKWLVAALGR